MLGLLQILTCDMGELNFPKHSSRRIGNSANIVPSRAVKTIWPYAAAPSNFSEIGIRTDTSLKSLAEETYVGVKRPP